MNPPFTNRSKMGEKFPGGTQQALRERVDDMDRVLIRSDAEMEDFSDKNTIRPLFVALADRCLRKPEGILAMINPTIALCAPSGLNERRTLAERYHIHTILTCHQPGNINMSQHTNVNESIIVAKRHDGPKPPTRFINLDKLPADEEGVTELHQALLKCQDGPLADGWGEVSYWPAERIGEGDWTPAVWRSTTLAQSSVRYANDPTLKAISDTVTYTVRSSSQRLYENFERTDQATLTESPYWIQKVLKARPPSQQHQITTGSAQTRTGETSRALWQMGIASSGNRWTRQQHSAAYCYCKRHPILGQWLVSRSRCITRRGKGNRCLHQFDAWSHSTHASSGKKVRISSIQT